MAAVPIATILDLARQGLSQGEIASRVGRSRQGVNYRIRAANGRVPPRSAAQAATGYPRTPERPPEACTPCGRPVGGSYGKGGPVSLLEEPDCCRWCARPLTDEAKARAPLAGYIELARTTARSPASVRAHRRAETDVS
jgi:hypothetical protein